jgi:hypothetical protein
VTGLENEVGTPRQLRFVPNTSAAHIAQEKTEELNMPPKLLAVGCTAEAKMGMRSKWVMDGNG